MKNILLIALLALSANLSGQTITGKKGNTYDVRNYETITIFTTTHILWNPLVTLDGYEELTLNRKGIITDGDRIIKGKKVKKIAYREAFWITYLRKNGFTLINKNEVEVTNNGGTVTPGTMTLTFTKN